MNHSTQKTIIALFLSLGLSACQSTAINERDYGEESISKRYQGLELQEAEDGVEVLRTVNPKIQNYSFNRMILDKIVMQPRAEASEQASTEVYDEIINYFDVQLRAKLSENHQLLDKPEPGLPRLKVVLTGVQLEEEGMRVTEVLPYGAVIGLIRKATDTRNKEVTVLIEVEVLDSETNEMLAAVIRAGQGEDIKMLWSPKLELEHVKGLLDDWVELAVTQLVKLNRE